MSVDRVETELRAPTIRPEAPWLRPSARSGVTAEKSAHKLRSEGLSYRRIAIELRVRYDQVSRWLSGPAPAAPAADPPRRPPSFEHPAVAPGQDQDHADAETAQRSRINDLMATLRQIARESREREERLHRVIEAERAAAREQAARRDAELNALRTMVNELAASVAKMQTENAPSWRGIWRRDAVR